MNISSVWCNCMTQKAHLWVERLKNGRISVADERNPRVPKISATYDTVMKMEVMIYENK